LRGIEQRAQRSATSVAEAPDEEIEGAKPARPRHLRTEGSPVSSLSRGGGQNGCTERTPSSGPSLRFPTEGGEGPHLTLFHGPKGLKERRKRRQWAGGGEKGRKES